jgi:hypothetical protein
VYNANSVKKAFTYNPPKDNQPERYKKINDAIEAAAHVILESTQGCDEQTKAIDLLREARTWANAAIACNE